MDSGLAFVYLWIKLKLFDMKENFIELTHGKETVVINLLNVAKITPTKDKTLIVFNFSKDKDSYVLTVDESYEHVKGLLGLGKKDFKYREV